MTTTAPPRFRETAFRFYEPVIASIVGGWPKVFETNPKNDKLSAITFSCRLRDAMTAWKAEPAWQSYVSRERFLAIVDEVCVSVTKNGLIRCGPREALREQRTANVFAATPTDSPREVVTFTMSPMFSINTICWLASNRCLNKDIRVSGLSATIVEEMQNKYDVFFIPTAEEGTYLLT